MNLRPIQQTDNARLAETIRRVFREFGIDRPGTVYTDPTTDRLYELFDVPGAAYWVCEEEGKLLGGCGIYPTEGLPDGCAELVKFYLTAETRGKGWGKELMQKAFDTARALGYRQLYLESFPELSRAVAMYEKAGFRMLNQPMGNSGHHACTIWALKDLITPNEGREK